VKNPLHLNLSQANKTNENTDEGKQEMTNRSRKQEMTGRSRPKS